MPRPKLPARTTSGVVAFVLAGAVCSGAQAANPQRADRLLDRALEALVDTPGGPPGAIARVQRGRRAAIHRVGVTQLESTRRWRASDHMRLASTSKAFSGAVALSLVRSGRLALGDTIGDRLPELPPAWSAVTLRQIMRHTSGLPSFTANQAFLNALGSDPQRRYTPRQLIDFVKDEPLEFRPGSDYAYSNTDNIVVGLMAEAVTGRSYERLLRSRVFRPLDLGDTTLPGDSRLPRPYVRGYVFEQGQPPEDVSEAISMSGVWASGGMQSTVLDLSRFIRGYVSGQLFGPALRRQQRRFVDGGSEPPGPGANSAGLGLFRYRMRCGTVYGHTGNFPGYTQFAAASANGRRSATVSINTQLSPDSGSPPAWRALRRAFGRAACAALASR